jgi:pyruvate dehydrogenase E2 component (dihydrolipoamide acetyltransferase)
MATILDMPQLSDTMKIGVLRKWRKNEGDKVSPGEVLAEVETDKATMDFEAFDEGVLLKRLVADGASMPVGTPIAIIGKAGEDVAALVEEAKGRSGGAKPAAKAEAPKKEAAKEKEAAPAPAAKAAPAPKAEAPKAAPAARPAPARAAAPAPAAASAARRRPAPRPGHGPGRPHRRA